MIWEGMKWTVHVEMGREGKGKANRVEASFFLDRGQPEHSCVLFYC